MEQIVLSEVCKLPDNPPFLCCKNLNRNVNTLFREYNLTINNNNPELLIFTLIELMKTRCKMFSFIVFITIFLFF